MALMHKCENTTAISRALKRHEFGLKRSATQPPRHEGLLIGDIPVHSNPYEGHSLSDALAYIEWITKKSKHVFVDKKYRDHGYNGDMNIYADKRKRGQSAKKPITQDETHAPREPEAGHLKLEHRMDRNRLKGKVGEHN